MVSCKEAYERVSSYLEKLKASIVGDIEWFGITRKKYETPNDPLIQDERYRKAKVAIATINQEMETEIADIKNLVQQFKNQK